ncbi:MAG: hypothetical protein ACLUI3_01275 [Christensenellales bacterium]
MQRAHPQPRADSLPQHRAHGRSQRRCAQRHAGCARAALPAFFGRILVDAPCSGEGMFRRQPEARDEWDADAPRRCADRQMEILAQAAKMLRPGGTMVYSTCTFNDTENEGVLKRFLALHPEFSLVPFALPGLPEAKDGYLHSIRTRCAARAFCQPPEKSRRS